jgi:CO/xanthine dehydrogenase FAD-binding subunit
VRKVALQRGEMVVALHVPDMPEGTRSAFAKLGSREYLVISIAMLAVNWRLDAAGRFDVARVAVGACSPVARRLKTLEAALIGQRPAEVAITREHLADLAPIDDLRGSAGYRLGAVAEMLGRTLREAGNG